MFSDYQVLSEFTLALFEDSGWYKGNYTALSDLKQNPLQWGKGELYSYVHVYHWFTTGLGCAFLTEQCTNKSIFPYLCDTSEIELVCTYDHLTKVQSCMATPASYVAYVCLTIQRNFMIFFVRANALVDGKVLMVALLQLPVGQNIIVELKQQ